MATAVGHRIGRDEVVWAFGPELEPVLEIDPGDSEAIMMLVGYNLEVKKDPGATADFLRKVLANPKDDHTKGSHDE